MTKAYPTARDVAKLAGVSMATVSYVLNGRNKGEGAISEATRKRVLDAVSELGYVPNLAARQLRRQHTERICVVFPQLGVPSSDALAQDVIQVAEARGYTVVILVSGSQERDQHVVGQLKRRLADGAILVHGSMQKQELQTLVEAEIPLVVFRNHIKPQGFDVVQTTEAEACYEAIAYLLQSGRRKIAFLGHPDKPSWGPEQQDMLQVYIHALRDHGYTLNQQLVRRGAHSRNEAYQAALELFQQPERPDALFVTADIAAISSIWAARKLGLRVPEDIAIIGKGNIPEGEISDPPLTTIGPVSFNFRDVAELLFRRIADVTCVEQVCVLEWKLILRGSA